MNHDDSVPSSAGRRRLLALGLAGGAGIAAGATAPSKPAGHLPGSDRDGWSHAWAAFGQPQLPPGYAHVDWVNPDATKGGTLALRNPDRRSSFDKLNPYSARGSAPAGLTIFVFESLAVMSADEPQVMYGLLAESLRVAPDRSTVDVQLHPLARFNDGQPVTASDVLHSFEQVSGPYASPAVRALWRGVTRAVVVDDRTVRFELRQRTTETVFAVGSLRVFSRRWGGGRRFDEVVTDVPIASGPYRVGELDMGRRIEFRRNPTYWARDLGVRRGMYNFDRVVYRYYKDHAVAREAFKAGDVHLYKEYDAGAWVRLHTGAKWRDGRIRKEAFATGIGVHMVAFAFNLRRPQFQDRRVRLALDLSFDFDTYNRYGLFVRPSSLFNNSAFAAQGQPSPGELALLEPFRGELPEAVFGLPYQPPRTNGDPRQLRRNLLQARALLEQAGWTLGGDGVLRNAAGQALVIEYLNTGQPGSVTEWQANLEMLGIRLVERMVDSAQFQRRLEAYDFDLFAGVEGSFTLPSAATLANIYSSAGVDSKGGGKFRGIRSAAVDKLLDAMAYADNLQALQNATRALDRVVMWNHWGVPFRYSADERVSYWNRFGQPAKRPRYYSIESGGGLLTPLPLATWWALPGAV